MCQNDMRAPATIGRAPARVLSLLTLISAGPLAQAPPPLLIATTDGRLLGAETLELRGAEASRSLAITSSTGSTELAWTAVLAIHGAAPTRERSGGAIAHLVGGDELRGEIRGGDRAGESFTLRSISLGEVSVLIDRLDVLRFVDRTTPGDLPRLRVAEGAAFDECVYFRARRGFDSAYGEIQRFEADGLAFAQGGGERIDVRAYESIAAIALRGGVPATRPGTAWLLTRAGDRVGVTILALADGILKLRLENEREIDLPLGELAALSPRHAGVQFLSELEPSAVRERSYFAEADEPLLPVQRDRSVVEGLLRAGGFAFGRGLGVHSASALEWTVPEGAASFVGFVALDDSVRDLPVRGGVAIAVLLDGKPVFERASLQSTTAPVPLGRIAVTPGQKLRLQVDFGEGLDLGDRVDWLDVAFVAR